MARSNVGIGDTDIGAVFDLMDGCLDGKADNILSRAELVRCLMDIEFPPAPKRQRVRNDGDWDAESGDEGGALHSTQSIEVAQTLASSAAAQA